MSDEKVSMLGFGMSVIFLPISGAEMIRRICEEIRALPGCMGYNDTIDVSMMFGVTVSFFFLTQKMRDEAAQYVEDEQEPIVMGIGIFEKPKLFTFKNKEAADAAS